MSADYIWTPPQYNVSHLPSQIGIVHLPPDPDFPENFIRTAKWYALLSLGPWSPNSSVTQVPRRFYGPYAF